MAGMRGGPWWIAMALILTPRSSRAQTPYGGTQAPELFALLDNVAREEHEARVSGGVALTSAAVVLGAVGAGLLRSASLAETPSDTASSNKVDGYLFIGVAALNLAVSPFVFFGSGPVERLNANAAGLSSQDLVARWRTIAERARATRIWQVWTLAAIGVGLGTYAVVDAFADHPTAAPVGASLLGIVSVIAVVGGIGRLATCSAAENGWTTIQAFPVVAMPLKGGAALSFVLHL